MAQSVLRKITGLNLDRVEMVVRENQPMYKVVDLRRQLGLKNSTLAVKSVDVVNKQLVWITVIDRRGRDFPVEAWFVNEAGIYQMLMHNRSVATKRIRNKVATDVLPLIAIEEQ